MNTSLQSQYSINPKLREAIPTLSTLIPSLKIDRLPTISQSDMDLLKSKNESSRRHLTNHWFIVIYICWSINRFQFPLGRLRKMIFKSVCLCILLIGTKTILSYNVDIPYSVLSKCKEYSIEEGYNYRKPFNISAMENNKPFSNEIFRLKFYVFTRNDAHLLITNLPKVQIYEPGYEIGKYVWV